jgi:rSAM/selenodomain-associated transferase 1
MNVDRSTSVARHVVVFARDARVGAGKTRLAGGVGVIEAWRFQRRMIDTLVRRLACPSRWILWLSVTPDRSAAEPRRWPSGAFPVPQGRGDLGARMARVMTDLPRGAVVIVGSDIPDLRRRHVERAFQALHRHDVVFGPAIDGGYWLVGLRRRPRPPGRLAPRLFSPVHWSGPDALADTVRSLPSGYSVTYLETLSDVDTADDLSRSGCMQGA